MRMPKSTIMLILLIMLIMVLISCSSDDGDDGGSGGGNDNGVAFNENSQIYNSDASKYYGDGFIKIRLYDESSHSYTLINAGYVTNGIVNMQLPTIANEYSQDFYGHCDVSPSDAKMFILEMWNSYGIGYFELYNSSGNYIGSFGAIDENYHKAIIGEGGYYNSNSLRYIYSSKAAKLTCDYGIDMDAKAGWNKLYSSYYNNSTENILTEKVRWILFYSEPLPQYSSSSGSSSSALPPASTPLTLGTFRDGTITSSNGEVWYSFNVAQGTTYYVYLNDSDNSDYTVDAKYAAYYSNGNEIFDGDYGYQSFVATANSTVYVKVYPYSSGTGTFSVSYDVERSGEPYSSSGGNSSSSDTSIWPPASTSLAPGVFNDGTITSSNDEVWYSFNVAQGTTYYVYLNDSDNSDYTVDAKYAAYYSNGNEIFDNDNSGYQYKSFVATSNDMVYIKVYPYSGGTGTFSVAYSDE